MDLECGRDANMNRKQYREIKEGTFNGDSIDRRSHKLDYFHPCKVYAKETAQRV